jgi:flagellar biosynthetic protein FliR
MMFPVWSNQANAPIAPEYFLAALASEVMLGLAVGIVVSYLAEILTMAAQSLSLQAGYGYATTIDPTTQADAGYLVVLAQLLAGLMFFTTGVDRQVLAILGRSYDRLPPGHVIFSPSLSEAVTASASVMFSTGLRLALPVIALLAMADIALALVGRLNAQLQVTTISFPAKMIAGLALLAWISALIPNVFQQSARQILSLVEQLTQGAAR